MGRRRSKRNEGLPPYVYRGKSAYEYQRYDGPGKPKRTTKLCPLDAPVSAVWKAYESIATGPKFTLGWLLNLYIASPHFAKKLPRTRRERERIAEHLKRFPLDNGSQFGDVPLNEITAGRLREYLDVREEQGAPVAGNREIAVISVAWRWAKGRDRITLPNPVAELAERNEEKTRDRYVTDNEYELAYQLAGRKVPYLQPAMELAYLCRMRRAEILQATRNDITSEGFETRRLKGSRSALTEWSERLKAPVNAALNTPRTASGLYLLQNKSGGPITEAAFKSAWRRLMNEAVEEQKMTRFHFHDLKAKGISDFEGDKQTAGGHKTPAMVARYDRKKPRVKPTR